MNVFIEGPNWMGCWTEAAEDALRNLGHRTGVFYHNRKTPLARITTRLNKLARRELFQPWKETARRMLIEAMRGSRWDVLLSIQGQIDEPTIRLLRQSHPGIRIVYWIGDVIDASRHRLLEFHEEVDFALVFSETIRHEFERLGVQRTMYFPFGVSRKLHVVPPISERDRERFSADVSFVGTFNAERCRMVNFLSRHLDQPVRVWGRGWRKCPEAMNLGRLSLSDTMKVYACSRISLNHHVHKGGLNIRFYEIPAVGGFQLCDWHDVLERSSVRSDIATYRDLGELLERVRYFLANEEERSATAARVRDAMLASDLYERRFQCVLGALGDEFRVEPARRGGSSECRIHSALGVRNSE